MTPQNSKVRGARGKAGIGLPYALAGIRHLLRTQRNARIHLALAFMVVCCGLLFRITATEWMLIVLCIGMVLAAEMVNTAIEHLTDLISPGFNEKAGRVKDLAAGAVLTSALAAAIVGTVIFAPRILGIIGTWTGSW